MGTNERINNYDTPAWFYDPLSALVFWGAQRRAQNAFIHLVPPGSKVLIAGGGTGKILEELVRIHPGTLSVTYVEKSGKMLSKARKRDHGDHQVQFVHAGIEDFAPTEPFDCLFTAFLFDNFTGGNARAIFSHLDGMLNQGGCWLYTDFRINRASPVFHKLLLKMMYVLFRWLCRVEATWLPDMNFLFSEAGYRQQGEKKFYGAFIVARLLVKPAGKN
ncbi:class I SAM-dependent methyltransferase [Hufsiella ginkgonis]|uniref:Methyltransferase domain-containing protein n=1 Tax=Hufsiella ginkgonis TaxID=2695274 RepID=A0A7K1XZS0_9SPHI|nr:methyltransferase domain-containing protein [Hufsiella ginkgonis]MXV16317.1 methyltransferase domain-containing protein [Hufsiella ginkgonis]